MPAVCGCDARRESVAALIRRARIAASFHARPPVRAHPGGIGLDPP
jgi:hypothetical protein